MKIPKGKKFTLYANKPSGGSLGFEGEDNSYYKQLVIPAKGYKGSSYLSQDVSINISNEFTNPFEGIFGGVPDTLDFIANAVGISFKQHTASYVKYWKSTSPLEFDLQVTFETLVDPYYDVWLPVMSLLFLCLPGEKAGFLVPPTPTATLVAKEFINFVQSVELSGSVGSPIESGKKQAVGALKSGVQKYFKETGYTFNLKIGENYHFENIIIKNIGFNFSTETCYAPLAWLNDAVANDPNKEFKALLNPYTSSDFTIHGICQTIGSLFAGLTSLKNQFVDMLETFGVEVSENANFPSLPIKCEVNMSVECQKPLTKKSMNNMFHSK